jgi:hypothetical protein
MNGRNKDKEDRRPVSRTTEIPRLEIRKTSSRKVAH